MVNFTTREAEVEECYNRLVEAGQRCGAVSIAKELNVSDYAASAALNRLRKKGKIPPRAGGSSLPPSKGQGEEFDVPTPPQQERPIGELIEARKAEFERNAAYDAFHNLIPVKIRLDGPIGIAHIGDPHIDNPGCDIGTLQRHIEIIKTTEGLLGANVGDAQDNWVGRLAHLYSKTTVSDTEAWKLVEWMVGEIPWLYIVGGNHDCHDMETECLTRRGWMKFGDIRDDDEVLSMDPATEETDWYPIAATISRPHKGKMLELDTCRAKFKVTPNHRVLKKGRSIHGDWLFEEAADLKGRVTLPLAGKRNKSTAPLSDDEISFAGWVLTDGSIKPNRTEIYQSKPSPDLDALLSRLPINFKMTVRHREIKYIMGKPLKSQLPQRTYRLTAKSSRDMRCVVSEKNTLPSWAWDMDDRQFRVFLSAVMAGDGSWYDRGVSEIGQLHGTEKFLGEFQALAQAHGHAASMSFARDHDCRLNICSRPIAGFDVKTSLGEVDYDGQVWCLTVPLGNFMIRRGGRAHFSGNCWSGSGDPLKWITGRWDKMGIFKNWQVRMNLKFPNKKEVRVNCRHDFAGHSMWNSVHGPAKAVKMGFRDHLLVCGHKHVSGVGFDKCPSSGLISNFVRVASYKKVDDYAVSSGFPDGNISPACVTIIDPQYADDDPRLITVIHDVEEGAEYLTWKRSRK